MHASEPTPAQGRETSANSPSDRDPHDAQSGGGSVLERQIAALSAQLRTLGERLASARAQSAGIANPTAAAPPPERPQAGPTNGGGATANGRDRPSPGAASGESIIVAAQAAAAEIRAAAEREAERIRAAAGGEDDRRRARLLEIVTRQSESLAVLSAEADRIERSAAALRAEVRALGSELQELLSSASATARGDH